MITPCRIYWSHVGFLVSYVANESVMAGSLLSGNMLAVLTLTGKNSNRLKIKVMSVQIAPKPVSAPDHEVYFNQLFSKEFRRLDDHKQIYLDYTGGALYGLSQLKEHFELLANSSFGNPHSSNPTSLFATSLVEQAREAVLEYFNAYNYHCIFTQNASSAIQIIGESYPFSQTSRLLMLSDNHNSINGIRSYCNSKNGSYEYASLQRDLTIDPTNLNYLLSGAPDHRDKLFAFPAQSNASGVKHDLTWIQKAQNLGWDVLLDASAFVPTSRLDLKQVSPDFVTLSFYKMFGYPTGIGCLLVSKDKFKKLKKPWFAGGTVKIASVKANHHILAEGHERFENGTINYLAIPAIKIGLDFIKRIGIDRINSRVASLSQYLVQNVKKLRHSSGGPILEIHGPENRKDCGGTISMNFFDALDNPYPFQKVECMANERSISIRTGCFCNPGVDETNHSISAEALNNYFSSGIVGDYDEMSRHLKIMRGAVRVSVGIATRKKDLDHFIDFVHSFKDLIQ